MPVLSNKYLTVEKMLLAAIIILGAITIRPFFMPILLAVITAYVLHPLVNGFRKLFKSYHLALIITTALVALPFALIIAYSINGLSPLAKEIGDLNDEISKALSIVENYLSDYGLNTFAANLDGMFGNLTARLKGEITTFVYKIPLILLQTTVYLFSTYYFLKDGTRIIHFFRRYIDTLEYKEKRMVESIMLGLKNSFDVLFISYIAVSVIVTIFAWVGFSLLDIPYATVLALLSGIFGFLPIFGVWMVYGSVGLYEVLQGDFTTAVMVILFGVFFLNIIPDFVIKPMVGSRTGKVHPLTILLGFFAGPIVFGINGFLIVPILLVILDTVVVSYMKYCIEGGENENSGGNHKDNRKQNKQS